MKPFAGAAARQFFGSRNGGEENFEFTLEKPRRES